MKAIKHIVSSLAIAATTMIVQGVSAKVALKVYEVGKAQPVGVIMLDDHPEVFFSDGMMTITTARADIFVNLRFDRIDHWEFSDASGSVDIRDIEEQAQNALRFYYNNEHEVLIENLPYDCKDIFVYEINGRRIQTDVHLSSGTARVSLNSLPKGIYIIKAQSQSFKIRKK